MHARAHSLTWSEVEDAIGNTSHGRDERSK